MRRILIFLFLLHFSSISSWPIIKPKFLLNSDQTCCILAKLNINATRANSGREYFAELILNNDSYKDVNEDKICSLMHFFMQEAVMNGRPIKFSKGFSPPQEKKFEWKNSLFDRNVCSLRFDKSVFHSFNDGERRSTPWQWRGSIGLLQAPEALRR